MSEIRTQRNRSDEPAIRETECCEASVEVVEVDGRLAMRCANCHAIDPVTVFV